MTDRKLLELSARHKQMARLLVGGHSQSEIGRLLEMHKSTVSRYVHDPLIVQEMKRLQEMADVNAVACVPGIPEKIREAAQKGIEILKEILSDTRDTPEIQRLKLNAALEVLSRAGYGPVKQVKIDQSSVFTHFTPEDIDDLKRRAVEEGLAPVSALNAHLVVDAEVIETGETHSEDAKGNSENPEKV
ncbi:MAG: hypothetical protein H8E19_08390 [Deltaproteobacteria bacterium]|uniref:Uncharacterized protein n=1 Tax=Candidatus Desulfacyla euxinica TaxID=2841693 RepID=A0A8J6T331_9DELT|nr:hypothetical protein [Candidatus Desulfacyla euxinica]